MIEMLNMGEYRTIFRRNFTQLAIFGHVSFVQIARESISHYEDLDRSVKPFKHEANHMVLSCSFVVKVTFDESKINRMDQFKGSEFFKRTP